MNFLKLYIKVLLFVFIMPVLAHSPYTKQDKSQNRIKLNINENWYYLENNTGSYNQASNENGWQNITLPHTWNYEDVVDATPGYRRSGSWYKKELYFETINKNEVYQLYFEGANVSTIIYVNGKKAATNMYAYLGFKVDITPFITQGNNEIMVRVDNGYKPELIPSQKNDFCIYGGITRDVWLVQIPQTHIEHLETETPIVTSKKASLKVKTTIANTTPSNHHKLRITLIDPNNKKVTSKTLSVKKNKVTVDFKTIRNPQLWDIENPNLYTIEVAIINNQNEIIDIYRDRIGFRWFEFKDHGPFYLNGKRVLLRGTHRHEENAGVGAAMSNQQHRNDMIAIKEMGANFVRLAHYPQDPEIYKMCDSLGILVWDELPWSRGGVGNMNWQNNTKSFLKKMILQNKNHPSIIIWSLGNEIYWLPDFPDGDDSSKINVFLKELNDLAHTLDPYRKTAIRKYYEGAEIVDVFSPSIWSGWYSGSYKNYAKAIEKYKKDYKHFLHAEYGGSSHLGRHTENPITGEGIIQSDGWEEQIVQTQVKNIAQIGDWSENYIVDLFDWHLRISETDTTFVGNAQWAFKDFATPLRPENDIPYINQKGVMDRDGNPKDAYYVYKSYWAKKPFTYIESHTWTDREGPEDKSKTISVYSNCPRVEFFFNGKSMGVKEKDIQKFPASGLTWDVHFLKGKNSMKAIGYTNEGSQVTDTLSVNYRFEKNGTAEALTLKAEKLENGNYLLTATAIDQNNLRCLDYEERVYFQCLEGGTLLANQGTYTGSSSIKMANGKAYIEVTPEPNANNLTVNVLNQNFKGTYLIIPLKL